MNSDIVILSDRIKELSHTKGQGAFVLDGELAGFSPFGDYYQYGDVVYYAATDGTNYEVGSGEYRQNGSDNELTRFPLRSTALDSGPYYLNGDSASGPTEGQQGYFYPLYLTKSAAMAVAGATSAHTHTFSGYHGVTFYMPNNHNGHAEASAASATGVDYVASGQPFDFPDFGIKEVYVTYPGKYSVFTGYGISGYREPKMSGVAFWGSEQLLNYDGDMMWSDERANLGISQTNPQFAIDVGGGRAYSQIRASGFFGGGSGIYFSGGQPLPQNNTKTASGGRQLEPFFRNELDDSTGTSAIFFLSGIVNERLCSLKQEKGTIYAGPASGCEDVGCSPDYPTFRYLTLEDIPDLSSLYVVQDREMVGIDPATLANGTIALYKESGVITYASGFLYTGGKLGIGTTSPNFTLDVLDGGAGISGNLIVSGDIYTKYGGNVHSSGGVFARSDSYFGNDVTVSGDLFVKGTTTYIDSTTVTIQDKQLELASTSGNDSYANADHLVDDGGIVVRSSGNGATDTGDKKWTWRTATNTWNAQTSNGENLGITSSGIIFNAGMGTVSGAYLAGSGLTLLNNNLTFAIGDMFKVGAVDSGNAGSDGNYVTNFVHQADEVGFSGTLGVAVNSSGFNDGIRIMIDPSGLSGVLSNAFLVSDGSGAPDLIGNKHTVFWSGGQGIDVEYNGFTNSGLFDIDASGLSGTLSYAIANAAGGYGGWKVHHPATSIDAIASNELLTISGVSGVITNYIPSTNNLIISPDGLSGVLTREINASGNKVSGAVVLNENLINSSGDLLSVRSSGLIALSGNFLRDQINASGMNISGVLGYTLNNLTTSNIAAATLVTSSEGVGSNDNDTTIPTTAAVKAYADSVGGGGGGSYAGWKLGADGYDQDTIASAELVTISGVSGVQTRYVPGSNTLLIDAVALSGNLQYNMDASGVAVSGFAKGHDTVTSGTLQGGINAASGWATATDLYTSGTLQAGINAVSGHSVYAAASASANVAGSGLIVQPELGGSPKTIHMNPFGSGELSSLDFNNDNIRIGYKAGGSQTYKLYSDNFKPLNVGYAAGMDSFQTAHSIFIGDSSGEEASGIKETVVIGSGAGYHAHSLTGAIAIGHRAGKKAGVSSNTVFLGTDAGLEASGCGDSVFIGYGAGQDAFACKGVSIGTMASYLAKDADRQVVIGRQAGRGMVDCLANVVLGDLAAFEASGHVYSNSIGDSAGAVSTVANYVDSFGYQATNSARELDQVVAIGYQAGKGMLNSQKVVAIGVNAAHAASGCGSGVFIGNHAGINVSGYSLASNLIGHTVGGNASHLPRANVMGASAFHDASGDYVVGLGSFVGAASSGCDMTLAIGRNAGYNMQKMEQGVFIGYEAGMSASGMYHNKSASNEFSQNDIFIGRRAGKLSNNSRGFNIAIGQDANGYAVAAHAVYSLGPYAGYVSYGCEDTLFLGHRSGFSCREVDSSSNLGYGTHGYSSGVHGDVAIGPNAGSSTTGGTNNIQIGAAAGYRRHMDLDGVTSHRGTQLVNNRFNTMIGRGAGQNGHGQYSILIGDYAGNEQYLEKAIVIIAGGHAPSVVAAKTDWIGQTFGSPDEYTVTIGNGIFGIDTSTRLGKKPSASSDFSSNILTVSKDSNTKIGLKTEMHTTSDTSDQIQASTDDAGHANTIVNSHGYLQVAVAKNKTGSGSSARLFTHPTDTSAKYEISRKEGTMAWYARHHSNDWRMYVYVNGRWREEGTGGGSL